jgi:hypothetical protein
VDAHPRYQTPPPPHFVRSPSPVSRGRMSSIVLAARLRARAMPRHSQRSSPPDIAVRRTASFGRLCRWSMLAWRPRVPVESTAQAPLRHGNDERKERNKKHRKRNADRRNWYFAAPYGHARAWIARRPSIGVPPRLWLRRPNATTQLQFRAS